MYVDQQKCVSFQKMQIKMCKMQQKRLTLINEALDTIVIGIQLVIRLVEKNNGSIKIFLILNKIWVDFYNGDEITRKISFD